MREKRAIKPCLGMRRLRPVLWLVLALLVLCRPGEHALAADFQAGDKVEASIFGQWVPCTVKDVARGYGGAVSGYQVTCVDLTGTARDYSESPGSVRPDTGEAAARLRKLVADALQPGTSVEAQIYGQWEPCSIGAITFSGFTIGGYVVRCTDLAGRTNEWNMAPQQVRPDTGEAAARNKKLLDAAFPVGGRVEAQVLGQWEPCTVAALSLSGYVLGGYQVSCADFAGRVEQWNVQPAQVRADTGEAAARNARFLAEIIHPEDPIEAKVDGRWVPCIVKRVAFSFYVVTGYSAECTLDDGSRKLIDLTAAPDSVRRPTGEAARRQAEERRWEEEASRNIALKYGGARNPRRCESRKEPESGPLTQDLAVRYLACDAEGENEARSRLMLIENVRVEIGRLRPGDGPSYAIRGSYTLYTCAALHRGDPTGGNCTAEEKPRARGVCEKDTDFDEWHCAMEGETGIERDNVPPPSDK